MSLSYVVKFILIKIKKKNMPTLVKVHPNGREEMKDGGSRVDAIAWNEDKTFKGVIGHEPIVGCSLLVGSLGARTYGNDYWLTTVVTEILERQPDYILFKTENSTYKLLI